MTALALHARHPFTALHLRRRRLAAAGAAMIGLAAAAVAAPALTSIAAGVAAGWLLWLAGAVMLGLSLLLLPAWLNLTGVVASLFVIAAGASLLFFPTHGALALAVLLVAVLVVDGSFQAALALKLRPVQAWRWVLASALSSLVAAGIMATGLPFRSDEGVGLLLGLAFATTGAGLLALATSPAPSDS